jgi:hypothetical protein
MVSVSSLSPYRLYVCYFGLIVMAGNPVIRCCWTPGDSWGDVVSSQNQHWLSHPYPSEFRIRAALDKYIPASVSTL